MGILNNIEEGLQSMDAYTIKIRMYNQMVRHADASLKNLVSIDPSWYFHTAISTIVIKVVHDIFYEVPSYNEFTSFLTGSRVRSHAKTIRIKRLFQLDDNEIDILIKAYICKIVDDGIYFDNRFINEMKVYMLEHVNA